MAASLMQRLKFPASNPSWNWPKEGNQWILDALEDSDREVRVTACNVVDETPSTRIIAKLTSMVENDPDPEVAARAAIALGPTLQMWDEDWFEDAELDDEEDNPSEEQCEQMLAAIAALAMINPPDSDLLLQDLVDDRDEEVASIAEYALEERNVWDMSDFSFDFDEDE